MATNQEKFDHLCAQVDGLLQNISAIVFQENMDMANYQVKDGLGRMRSQLDLVREVGGNLAPATWYGFDGQIQPAGQRNTTNVLTAVGWQDAIAATARAENAALRKALENLSIATGVTVDYDAIASEVADELDQRNRARLAITPEAVTVVAEDAK